MTMDSEDNHKTVVLDLYQCFLHFSFAYLISLIHLCTGANADTGK